jgi:hypothetical protein
MSAFFPRGMNTKQQVATTRVRAAFVEVEKEIAAVAPQGRYYALAMTMLEAACMWAVKAITHEWKEEIAPPRVTPQTGMTATEIEQAARELKPGQGQE